MYMLAIKQIDRDALKVINPNTITIRSHVKLSRHMLSLDSSEENIPESIGNSKAWM